MPAADAPVIMVTTIERLQDPERWMGRAGQNALGEVPWPGEPNVGDWAVFTVSIDRVGLKD